MLTGDKVQTAIEIGVSAGLIDQSMDRAIFEEDNKDKLRDSLEK